MLIGDAFVLLHEIASGKEIQNPLLLALLCVSFEAIEDFAPELVGWLKELPGRVPQRKCQLLISCLLRTFLQFNSQSLVVDGEAREESFELDLLFVKQRCRRLQKLAD